MSDPANAAFVSPRDIRPGDIFIIDSYINHLPLPPGPTPFTPPDSDQVLPALTHAHAYIFDTKSHTVPAGMPLLVISLNLPLILCCFPINTPCAKEHFLAIDTRTVNLRRPNLPYLLSYITLAGWPILHLFPSEPSPFYQLCPTLDPQPFLPPTIHSSPASPNLRRPPNPSHPWTPPPPTTDPSLRTP